MTELWAAVPEFEHIYHASSYGRVKSIKRVDQTARGPVQRQEMILRPATDSKGYKYIKVRPKGAGRADRYNYRVHRMVMAAFYGPSELQVDHINMVRDDNRLKNLRYVTSGQNRIAASTKDPEMAYITYIQKRGIYQVYVGDLYFGSSKCLDRAKGLRDSAVSSLKIGTMDIRRNDRAGRNRATNS